MLINNNNETKLNKDIDIVIFEFFTIDSFSLVNGYISSSLINSVLSGIEEFPNFLSK